MTKPTMWLCAQRRLQFSLGIRPVWSESSLCPQWVAKGPSFLHADSEDSDQTGRMPRLIWVFAGRTCHFVSFVTRRLIFKRTKRGGNYSFFLRVLQCLYLKKNITEADLTHTCWELQRYVKYFFVVVVVVVKNAGSFNATRMSYVDMPAHQFEEWC